MEYNELTEFEEINVCENDNENIDVTILCTTYNQNKYIRNALDSFLDQDTDLRYEILIFDDCSTDGTSETVREYAKRNPKIVKAFIAKKNTYNNPLRNEAKRALENRFARGKFLAFCEGDDYWIDNRKIQKQWEALNEHLQCDMCACWGCTVSEDGKSEISQIRPKEKDGILTPEEVILGGGQYVITAGLFFRKDIKETQMNFEKVLALDYVTQIKGSLRGGIYYLDQKMAVYRRYSEGSWTLRILRNKEKLNEHWKIERKMLMTLDDDTGGKYHRAILERLKSYTTFSEQLEMNREELQKLFSSFSGKCYLWGMGRRGTDFEEFCHKEGFHIDGVCDSVNENISGLTSYGNKIVGTDEVIRSANVILASNSYVYQDLISDGFTGVLVDLQKYMPLG